MWTAHSALITNIMNADIVEIPPGVERSTDRAVQEIRRSISDNLFDIQKRNEAILFLDPPSKGIGRLGTAVVDVKVRYFLSSEAFSCLSRRYSSSIPSQQPQT